MQPPPDSPEQRDDPPDVPAGDPDQPVCAKCGGSIDENDLVCPHCGVSLVAG